MQDAMPADAPELDAAPARPRELEYKTFEFKLDADPDDEGVFDGYASVFGNTDSHGDIIEPGAFKKTLRDLKGRVPILWQHDSYEPIGVSIELEEDGKGLRTRGKLVLSVRRAQEARDLLLARALRGLSIGFNTVKGEVRRDQDGKLLGRTLKELRLWEYSIVTFPANALAVVGDVKTTDVERLARLLDRIRDDQPDLVRALLSCEPPDGTRDPEPPAAPPAAEALAALESLRNDYLQRRQATDER